MTIEPAFTALLDLPLPRRIMAVLADAGGEARFVGGVVRDAWLGTDPASLADIDMATTLTPDAVIACLGAARLKVIPTGIEHGTVTVVDPARPKPVVELTTLREDINTFGRHAEVRFGIDWIEDARRRDFTINTLYLAGDGTLYDPFGGIEDLRAGVVRFVGTAHQRIEEDYLRMLRFFRFHARYGKAAPDEEAITAITALASRLDRISGERIAHEMRGILSAATPATLAAMTATGIDRGIAPSGFRLRGVEALLSLGPAVAVMARFGFLIAPDDALAVIDRLKLSKREARLLQLVAAPVEIEALAGEAWRQVAWQMLRQQDQAMEDLASRFAVASIRQQGRVDPAAFDRLAAWVPPVLPVGGDDIRARGLPTGEALGAVLRELENAWVASDFTLDRPALLKTLDAILASR